MNNNDLQNINNKVELSLNDQFDGAIDYINSLNGSIINKISTTEILGLGTAISTILPTQAASAATGQLFRCVYPQGVTGTLAMKDGMNLGAILNNGSIVGQARWEAVNGATQGAGVAAVANPAVVMAAVALLAITMKLDKIDKKQEEIIYVLERDKKSQLLADTEILREYLNDYQYYMDNESTLTVKLNQTMNIKRNAKKDIKSYREQIDKMLENQKGVIGTFSASNDVKKMLDRFVHYKLSMYVFSFASYMEVMLARNYQSDYLKNIENELRKLEYDYKVLYTNCYDVIENLKGKAIEKHLGKGVAVAAKATGKFIGKMPIVSKGKMDETLIAVGENVDQSISDDISKTLEFFISNKDSGLIAIADNVNMLNNLANKPIEVVSDNKIIYFIARDEERATV